MRSIPTRRDGPVTTPRPYRDPTLTPEREAAVERALALLREAKPTGRAQRFTRDEMHERRASLDEDFVP